ncbi:hypothetical protein [Paenibacillus glycinis]|uniref:Uncharacterized protein n=1 Tax=Paenibacillus glycinis TaxID=2697035 RepID=A0ABW9Y1Y5_9BACL|nr:hypothetical protein [Paenibacillus glycinis]NBD28392.1 hypothetical protein [Paenibacillus glycinis]
MALEVIEELELLEQKFSGIYSDVQEEAKKNDIRLSEYHFAYAHIAQDKFSITFYHNEFSDDSFYLNYLIKPDGFICFEVSINGE